jgi:peptidoglycan/xylan/chitin deacetylase (PgdA/CDA1 family)
MEGFMRKLILIITSSLLLLTGCQTTAKIAVSATPTPLQTEKSTGNSLNSPGLSTPTASANGSSTIPSSSPAAPDTVQKLYHMNKNYYIIPNDPAKTDKHVVLLTFDDGPKKKEWIESIINTLNKHHTKAIFYEIGSSVKDHPDLLKFTFDSGETIGNHTWTHPFLNKLTNAQIDQEYEKTQEIIKQTIGIDAKFFRAPHAAGNDYTHLKAKQMGMLYMNWSDGSEDWEPAFFYKPAKIIANTLKQLNPGSIILMHELSWSVQMLDELLTDIEQKGYTFVDPSSIDLSYDDTAAKSSKN